MKPISYREFEEKINELGADVNHCRNTVEVNFGCYTVGDVSKNQKFQINTDYGYVEEFEKAEMTEIIKLMLRLSATEISDRTPRYKFKIPNCHENNDVFSWLNVDRETNKIAISSEEDTVLWQTTFTEKEIESLPEEVRKLLESMEVHEVEN